MAGFDDTAAGVAVPNEKASAEPAVTRPEEADREADREYDRRGVLLPRKAKVGGIITPQ